MICLQGKLLMNNSRISSYISTFSLFSYKFLNNNVHFLKNYPIFISKNHLAHISSELESFKEYEPVIGLEIHAQLNLKTKLFSDAINKYAYRANSLVSPFDLSLPGTLPRLNKRAVLDAIRTGLALNCTIASKSSFDRKHYFYPDLPNGYQITQQREPIAHSGYIDFVVYDDFHHTIGLQDPSAKIEPRIQRCHLKQIQLEQDSGKSLVDTDENLIDLNRAGVALLEFVFEPELHSTIEATSLIYELIHILKILGTCTGKLEQGELRVDANISVRKKSEPIVYKRQNKIDWKSLGTRTEVKNLNSFRFIREAIQYEIQRQIGLLHSGREIVQETLAWDYSNKRTISLRDKEIVQDYRFMPEPNLPPIFVLHQSKQGKQFFTQNQNDDPSFGSVNNEKNFEQVLDHVSHSPEFDCFSVEKVNLSLKDCSEPIHECLISNNNIEPSSAWDPINLSPLAAEVDHLQLPARIRSQMDVYGLTLSEKYFLSHNQKLRELFVNIFNLYPAESMKHEKGIFIFDFLFRLTSGLLDMTLEPINVERLCEKIQIENLTKLLWMLDSGRISKTITADLIGLYLQGIQNKSPDEIVKQFNWELINDQNKIEMVCKEVIAELPKVAKAFAKKGVRKPKSMLIQKAQLKLENRVEEEVLWKKFEQILRK